MDIVCLVAFTGILHGLLVAGAGPGQELAVQWSFHRLLYDYKSYGTFTLQRVDIPQHTLSLNLSLKAYSSSDSCDKRQVKIFGSLEGLPVVSRAGEELPKNSLVMEDPVVNMTMSTNNNVSMWTLEGLPAGTLFLMSILPREDTRIRQQGLDTECEYFISLNATLLHEPSLESFPVDLSHSVQLLSNKPKLLSFHIPKDVLSFTVEITGCPAKGKCPVKVSLQHAVEAGLGSGPPGDDCVWSKGRCLLEQKYPLVDWDYYVALLSTANINLNITVSTTYCNASYQATHQSRSLRCLMRSLGRETPALAKEGSNMYDHFVWWDRGFGPHSTIDLNALDHQETLMSFNLRTTDVGSSLTVTLRLPEQKLPTQVEVSLCVSRQHLANATSCKDGALLQLNSLDSVDSTNVLLPFPQSGQWYAALLGRCFQGTHRNGSSIPCTKHVGVNITIHLSPCVEGGCGKYGECKLYYGANLLYCSCECYDGWRGYGCNDGSEADNESTIKLGLYLLTLSNLFFIPGTIVALSRRHFVEAAVYAFNMFFSTFYHACDSSMVYRLCIMPYQVLSFADFFGSLLSFWVTLMAMARVPPGVRAFCHMAGVLFIAVAVMHNKHGLLEQLVPIALGIATVIGTWGREMYLRKTCFPSRKRLQYFIAPGILLAGLGLIFNVALETESNYKYMHSVWHVLVSCSIVFLLPPRRDKSTSNPSSLSLKKPTSSKHSHHNSPKHSPKPSSHKSSSPKLSSRKSSSHHGSPQPSSRKSSSHRSSPKHSPKHSSSIF